MNISTHVNTHVNSGGVNQSHNHSHNNVNSTRGAMDWDDAAMEVPVHRIRSAADLTDVMGFSPSIFHPQL